MKSKIILSLLLLLFVISVIGTFSELVRCLNSIAVILLAVLYFKTSHGKELINKVYCNIIK